MRHREHETASDPQRGTHPRQYRRHLGDGQIVEQERSQCQIDSAGQDQLRARDIAYPVFQAAISGAGSMRLRNHFGRDVDAKDLAGAALRQLQGVAAAQAAAAARDDRNPAVETEISHGRER